MATPIALQPQKLVPQATLAWHDHALPYAALVLDGGYVEAGDGGRRRTAPGHVVVHSPFSAHGDVVGHQGATVINLPLSMADALALHSGVVADPDELLRRYADDPASLGAALRSSVTEVPGLDDLPDRLASALDGVGAVRLVEWADAHWVSPRTLTRQFTAAFGIAPAHYRWRARARRAWRSLLATELPLAAIAHDCGFADQAHMSRSIGQLTGRPPFWWRRLSD
jgi:AraC-like DNA-binding protein